jgi:hypothetical protein
LAEPIEGADAAIEVDTIRPYGVRLIARRSENIDAPGSTRVEFYIASPAQIRAAA